MRTFHIGTWAVLGLLASSARAERVIEQPEAEHTTGFAVLIDAASWEATAASVRRYARAVEADGLACWIVIDDWEGPEDARDVLLELYQHYKQPIEGALLAGAVPIPMIRDAQHLTSAFKMDQERHPWRESSVPSDRYYEDFDLEFTPLGRDEEDPRLHYYSLAPESAQRVEKELYTARLAPPAEGAAGHAQLAECFERFARKKSAAQVLDRVLTLMGHGYLSSSPIAWEDTIHALREQLPCLSLPGSSLACYHHDVGPPLEATLLRELSDVQLDLALLHSHGAEDRQYLLGTTLARTNDEHLDQVRRDLRARLRRARDEGEDLDARRAELGERYGVPVEWFEGAFDEELTRADEAEEELKELTRADLATIAPGPELVVLDSCFNGCFIDANYVAGEYLFGPGEVVACVANSVNVAQDVWADQGIGLLAHGSRVGEWHRLRPHLESHLFGDPTLRFTSRLAGESVRREQNVRRLGKSDSEWLRGLLLRYLRTDPASGVRAQALSTLARRRGPEFEEGLLVASSDPSEFLRRQAVALMGDVGREDYIEPLARAALRDPSERVRFRAREALKKYRAEQTAETLRRLALEEVHFHPEEDWLERFVTACTRSAWIAEDFERAGSREAEEKQRLRSLRTFRLYRVQGAPEFLSALAGETEESEAVRSCALEVMGWYVYSRELAALSAACAAILEDTGAPKAVRGEALKTARRLEAGPNDPLLP